MLLQQATVDHEENENQKPQARQTTNDVQHQDELHHPNHNLRRNFGKPSVNLRVHIQPLDTLTQNRENP